MRKTGQIRWGDFPEGTRWYVCGYIEGSFVSRIFFTVVNIDLYEKLVKEHEQLNDGILQEETEKLIDFLGNGFRKRKKEIMSDFQLTRNKEDNMPDKDRYDLEKEFVNKYWDFRKMKGLRQECLENAYEHLFEMFCEKCINPSALSPSEMKMYDLAKEIIGRFPEKTIRTIRIYDKAKTIKGEKNQYRDVMWNSLDKYAWDMVHDSLYLDRSCLNDLDCLIRVLLKGYLTSVTRDYVFSNYTLYKVLEDTFAELIKELKQSIID